MCVVRAAGGLARRLNELVCVVVVFCAAVQPEKDPNIVGDPLKTVMVARINFETTEDTVRAAFQAFGRIERLRLVKDCVTGASKGYAFIEYETNSGFEAAFNRGHGMVLDGARLLVDYMRSRGVMKGWKPRRLGGGLGGRKQSGQLRFGGREQPHRVPFNRGHNVQASRASRALDPTH